MEITNEQISYIFNEMKLEYDDLRDLWYSWLFSRLHYFIAQDISQHWGDSEQRVLDIGCGTGFQSFLYAFAGAEVVGIDIASELIDVAQEKIVYQKNQDRLTLFPSFHPFVDFYDEKINSLLLDRFLQKEYKSPVFAIGNAVELNFPNEDFTHVNCCGSVLSFVESYEIVLAEIRRVLKPGGTFTIEVESKYSPDALWTLLDSLTGGRLGFESTVNEALKLFRPPFDAHTVVEYPFGEVSDPVYMSIILFTKSKLRKELIQHGLHPKRIRTIHSITNIIPSTVLDSPKPSNFLKRFFYFLGKIENFLPKFLPGCSLVISGTKKM